MSKQVDRLILLWTKQTENPVLKPRSKLMGNVTVSPFIFASTQSSEPEELNQLQLAPIKIPGLLSLGSRCVLLCLNACTNQRLTVSLAL